MKPTRNPFLRSATLAASIVFTLGISAQAANYYWNTITTGSWDTSANWSDNPASGGATGVVPFSTDSVFFNQSSVNGAETVQLSAPASITGITFANTGTTLINASAAGSQALTIGSGGITVNSSAGAVTIGNATNQVPITLGGAQAWTNSSINALNIVNAVNGSTNLLTLTGNTTAANANGNTFNLQGGLIGSGGVTLTGNATNTITLNVIGAVSGNNVLGTGAITTAGAGSSNYALNFNQTGGAATVGSLSVSNPTTFTIGGTGAVGFGAFTQTSGGAPTLTNNNSGGVSFTSFALNTGGGAGLIIDGSGTTTITGAISTAKTLTYSGTGSLNLNNTSSTLTALTISGGFGTVNVASNAANSALAAGSVTIGSGSTLQINTTAGVGSTIANTFNAGTGLVKLNFAASGTATNTAMSGLSAFTGTLELATPGNTRDKLSGAITASNTALIINSGTTLFVSGTQSFGSIRVTGTGNAEDLGAIRLNGQTLNGNITLAGSTTIGGSAGGTVAGTITSGASGTQILTLNNSGSSTFSSAIGGGTGTIALTNLAGINTLNGTNSYTGATLITGGTLKAGSSSALGVGSALTVTSPGTLDLAGFSNTVGSMVASTGTITDSSAAGSGGKLTVTASTGGLAVALTGSLAVGYWNSNGSAFFSTNTANTYSGGTTLGIGLGSSGRARLSPALNETIGNAPGASLTSGKFGTGPIYIGLNSTDQGQIYLNSANVTINNPIVVNSAAGTDTAGTFRVDTTGHVIAGAINANLAALTFRNNTSTGAINLTGAISGAQGLTLSTSNGTSLTVTLTNLGTPNSYVGNTTISSVKETLKLGAANQIPNGANTGNLTLNTTGKFDMNGFSETINGLISTSTAVLDGNAAGVAGTNTLTLGDNNANGNDFTGTIKSTVGVFSLTKIGSGTQTLSGTNTYTGLTTLSAGILRADTLGINGSSTTNGIAFGGGTLMANTATGITTAKAISATNTIKLDTTSGPISLSGTMAGANGLTLSGGANTLTITGAKAYSGVVTINSGNTLAVDRLGTFNANSGVGNNAINSAGNLIVGGTLKYAGTGAQSTDRLWTIGSATGATLDASGSTSSDTINYTNTATPLFSATGTHTLTLSGSNTGANTLAANLDDSTAATSLTKSSTGAWTLSGTNAYAGATAVNGGTLTVSGVLGSGGGTAVTTTNAGTAFNVTNTNGLTGTSSLAIGTGTTVTLSAANNYSGTTSVTGTLQLQNAGSAASSALTLNSDAIVQLKNNTNNTSFSSSGVVSLAANVANMVTIDVDNNGSGTGNTLALANGLRWTTNTGTVASTINVTGGNTYLLSIPTVAFGGTAQTRATLGFNPTLADVTIGSVTATVGTVGAKDATLLFNGSGDGTVTGTISQVNTGSWLSLTKQGLGTWTIFGNNTTVLGPTVVSAGILNIRNSNALGSAANGTSSVTAGATLQLQGGGVALAKPSFTLNGTGVSGAGALENVSGNNSVTGNIVLGSTGVRINSDANTLTLNTISGTGNSVTFGGSGNITVSGAISTGAAATLTKDGAGTLTLSGLNIIPSNNYSGTTTIGQGTLAFTTTNPSLTGGLTFGDSLASANVGVLDLSAASATFGGPLTVQTGSASNNTVTLGSGKTLAINGTGSIAVTTAAAGFTSNLDINGGNYVQNLGAGALVIGSRSSTVGTGSGLFGTLDLSDTNGVSITGTSASSIQMGITTVGSTAADVTQGTLKLSAAGTNGISVGTMILGNTSSGIAGIQGYLILGNAANNLSVDAIYVARQKSNISGGITSSITFDGSGGTLTLGGLSGAKANMNIGYNDVANTGTTSVGVVDLSNGTFNGTLGTVTVGFLTSGAGGGKGTLTIGAGTTTADSVVLASTGGTTPANTTGTFNLNGGTFTLASAGTGITSNGGVATLKLAGGTLDLSNTSIGDATKTVTLTAEFGTLKNVAQINGGTTGLNKTTTGTLTLSGTNTYTGTTTVNAGKLIIGTGGSLGNTAVTVGGAFASGTPTLGGVGSIGGHTLISTAAGGAAGTHAPGLASVAAGVGTQAFSGNLTYGNGSIFEWDINANKDSSTGTAGTDFDNVTVSGNLNGSTGIDTSIFRVIFGTTAKAGIQDSGNVFWNTASTSRAWSMTSLFGKNFTSGMFTDVETYDASGIFNVSAYGSFSITGSSLTWTAVPEPTSALAGLLIGAGLLRRRRQCSMLNVEC